MKIKSVTPDYTGGGVYIFLGELDNGQYFMSEDVMYSPMGRMPEIFAFRSVTKKRFCFS